MDSNEKKGKRPRIGARPISAANMDSHTTSDFEQTSKEGSQQEHRSYGNQGYNSNRPYQQRPYNNRQGGYQNNRYNNQGGGYQNNRYNNRQGGYQQRPYAPQTEGTPTDGAANESASTDETTPQATGYQPRNNYNRQGGYQQGGYQPRNNYNRQGGYGNNNRQGGYQPRGAQGGYGNNNRQGGYQQRGAQGGYGNNNRQGGYQQRGAQGGYGNNNRQGGYQQRGAQGGYGNNNRQGGYGNKGPRQNQFGMPQGGRSFTPRPKRVEYEMEIPDPNEQIRLNKYMANAGLCSRREADEYILQGLIKVNGNVVTELGTKISHSDVVEYDEKIVALEKKCYILLNKPKDCVTTSDDPNGRLTVMDLVKGACEERIYPVGRLDRNTTGVLLLTNDGDLASKLTHPKFVKKKIYHVWTDKDIAEDDMQRIADGIELDDGPIHADAISYATETDRNQAGIEIHSGRNRIVRRIFESLGYHVTKLDRVYFAGLTKKNLPRGRWRYLTQEEVNYLKMGSFE